MDAGKLSEFDIEHEIQWEQQMIEHGVDRYRKMVEEANFSDTTAGQKVIMKALGDPQKGSGAILAVMNYLREVGESERLGELNMITMLSDPLKIAVITVKTILTFKSNDGMPAKSFTSISRIVGNAIIDNIKFEEWRRRKRREAREGGLKPHEIARIIKRVEGASRWKIKRMLDRMDDVFDGEIKDETILRLGADAVTVVVEACDDLFEFTYVRSGNRTIRRVGLTNEARELIRNINDCEEFMLPYRLPTIIPPRDWREVEPEPKENVSIEEERTAA